MTRPPSLQIQNFLMKNRKSLNSGLTGYTIYHKDCLPRGNDVMLSVKTQFLIEFSELEVLRMCPYQLQPSFCFVYTFNGNLIIRHLYNFINATASCFNKKFTNWI